MRATPSGATRTSAPGNYHAATARLYEDLGIFTADEEITADVADLFNYITGFGRPQKFRKLLVAPFTLRSGLVDEIRGVAAAAAEGKHARIRLKLNHLVDPKIVEELYAASRAGAKVDIIARSTCALRPGVDGLSDNIHVRSVVGRFLEHSRIYSFEAGERVATYIGSPDLMQRNLDHRIEVLMPVENARVRQEVHAILDSALEDDTNAWVLGADGDWTRVVPAKPAKPHSHHATMMRRSLKRARRGARERRAGVDPARALRRPGADPTPRPRAARGRAPGRTRDPFRSSTQIAAFSHGASQPRSFSNTSRCVHTSVVSGRSTSSVMRSSCSESGSSSQCVSTASPRADRDGRDGLDAARVADSRRSA